MEWIKQFQIEHLKMRHTFYGIYQILCTFGVVFAIVGIFLFYSNKIEIERIRLFYDMVAAMLPILASVSIALMMMQEEQVGNLFGMLFLENRKKAALTKILYNWGIGNIGFILGSIIVASLASRENWKMLLQLIIGFFVYGMFFYVFHMYVNLKFGMGISIFLGLFETMQGIIYSNIQIGGMFRFIPFSWVIQWEQNVLRRAVKKEVFFSICYIGLSLLFILVFLEWFQRWEGRKKYEE